jgi:hypothetical protein
MKEPVRYRFSTRVSPGPTPIGPAAQGISAGDAVREIAA